MRAEIMHAGHECAYFEGKAVKRNKFGQLSAPFQEECVKLYLFSEKESYADRIGYWFNNDQMRGSG